MTAASPRPDTVLRWAILLLAGCALDEDRFIAEAGAAYCARYKACDERAYWTTWEDGTPACEADLDNRLGDKRFGNGNVACTWQADPAQDCLDAIAQDDCDPILTSGYVDACADPVWDCVSLVRAVSRD